MSLISLSDTPEDYINTSEPPLGDLVADFGGFTTYFSSETGQACPKVSMVWWGALSAFFQRTLERRKLL